MGMDVCRYIEVYTNDYDGYIYLKKDIDKIGKLLVGDVVMVYNSYGPNHDHYFEVSNVSIDGYIEYKPIRLPDDIHRYMKAISELNVVYRCDKYKDLPNKQLSREEGVIYKYYDNCAHYIQMQNGEWVELDKCPASWKQVKWKDKHNYISSCCNTFIREFIMNSLEGEGKYAKRGLPNDITESVKNDMYETDFNHTYCSLEEIEQAQDLIEQKVKAKLLEKIKNNQFKTIDNKLETILSILKKETVITTLKNNEDDYEETFDEVYKDSVIAISQAAREYAMIETMVDELFGPVSPKNVRVIYTFNN